MRGTRGKRSGSVLAFTAVLGLGWWLSKPELLTPYGFSRVVRARDGQLLRMTLAPDQTFRRFVPLREMSEPLVEATLLYEDRHFFQHAGVNPLALAKAFLQTYLQRGARRGGSTLTMQVARLRYRIDSSTVTGKLEQMARAFQLELHCSKAELLEAYLNLAPYGGNVEGAGAASLVYFGKEPAALSLPEAMALAVMPQSPSKRAPVDGREPASLKAARERLVRRWKSAHPSAKDDDFALEAPLNFRTVKQLPFLAPHAVERALRSEGQTLTLTLERPTQTLFERVVSQYVERRSRDGIQNAAVLLADTQTHEVLAYVGSADFHRADIEGQVDGTQARRSAGSALKPFVYARALDEGLIHPRTVLRDVPSRFGAYDPENFDSDYLGPLSATEALVKSRNVPAVELDLRLQRGLYSVLSQIEVKGLREREHYGAGLVLGGGELTMHELLALYTALANQGRFEPLRLTVSNESPLRSSRAESRDALFSPEASELTLAMLRTQERFDASVTVRDDVPVAWKTGTSFAFRDAWSVGVAGRYALAVWVGNFDGSSNPSFVGRSAAAPLFFELVDALRPRLLADPAIDKPAVQLETVKVCAVSGKLPGRHCPRTVSTQVIVSVSPIHVCDVHREVQLDLRTGLRACRADPGRTRSEIFEFWPSDIARLFEKAGLGRRSVPRYEGPCELDDSNRRAPTILSPQPDLTYQLRHAASDQAHLPLLAHADAEAKVLTWFADAELVGSTAPGRPLDWAPLSGHHQLRVVDDLGQSASVSIEVRWAP